MPTENNLLKEPNIASIHKEMENILFRDISIWLDTYDDIFSDFDPRPYINRTLSDDFISELQKVSKEQDKMINELTFLLPKEQRNNADEVIITKRLHNFFKINYNQYKIEYKNLWKRALYFTFTGILLMLAASYLSTLESNIFLIHLLLVIFQPSGWFLVWVGFDMILYQTKQKKKELNFYNKLSKSKINFFSINERLPYKPQ